ncbi:MAG: hypothetical protein ACKOEY_11390 [Phenylobacterium sp.]
MAHVMDIREAPLFGGLLRRLEAFLDGLAEKGIGELFRIQQAAVAAAGS